MSDFGYDPKNFNGTARGGFGDCAYVPGRVPTKIDSLQLKVRELGKLALELQEKGKRTGEGLFDLKLDYRDMPAEEVKAEVIARERAREVWLADSKSYAVVKREYHAVLAELQAEIKSTLVDPYLAKGELS